jgi:hypothetical protein
MTNRARAGDRYRKFVASRAAKNLADAFIDPQAYRAYIDATEDELRSGVAR